MNHDLAAIRRFLAQAFDDEELKDLCLDYFPKVYDDFTTGMAKSQMTRDLVAYCQRRGKVPDLMAALERERPEQAKEHFPPTSPAHTAMPKPPTPPRRNPRQVFISHAHQDADFAQRLAADLRVNGWPVWLAPDSIRPGEKWVEAINRGLEESGVFVLALTPAAVNSRWVQSETNVAIELEHQGEIRFIPLEIEPSHVPYLWRAYQRVLFRSGYEDGLQVLLQQLAIREGNIAIEASGPLPPAPSQPRPRKRAPKKTPEPAADTRLDAKTGLVFVRVPAGDFLYGEDKKKVYLPEFWISKTPVTQAAYKRFLDANPKQPVPYRDYGWAKPYNWDKKARSFPEGKADHPAVLVSWDDAQAYCQWAGMRLPTEEEWEKAARGTDGREYPWGDEWQPDHCNSLEAGVSTTTPVGRYSPGGDSPYGCIDMGGNVWEWTDSWFDDGRSSRVLRGGSWFNNKRTARVSVRQDRFPDLWHYYIGFRLVSPVGFSS
jgi:formylglycine-generating enzyme required for sulfatase activity